MEDFKRLTFMAVPQIISSTQTGHRASLETFLKSIQQGIAFPTLGPICSKHRGRDRTRRECGAKAERCAESRRFRPTSGSAIDVGLIRQSGHDAASWSDDGALCFSATEVGLGIALSIIDCLPPHPADVE